MLNHSGLTAGALDERELHTHAGMASWGKEGPAGTVCGGCSFYRGSCDKFRILRFGTTHRKTGERSVLRPAPKFPANAASCRHFDPKAAAVA